MSTLLPSNLEEGHTIGGTSGRDLTFKRNAFLEGYGEILLFPELAKPAVNTLKWRVVQQANSSLQ